MGQWSLKAVDTLSESDLQSLFDGALGMLHFPGFFTQVQAEQAFTRVCDHGLRPYEYAPDVKAVGIAANGFKPERGRTMEEYLNIAAEVSTELANVFDAVRNPATEVIAAVSDVWGRGDVGVATDKPSGRTYFAGIVRDVAAAGLHWDWAPNDLPGWSIAGIDAQLTWNVYLSVPQSGGEVAVFKRVCTPTDQSYRIGGSYAYGREVVQGVPFVGVVPKQGDLVVFNPRHYHEVKPGTEGQVRISASSFFGRFPTGSIEFWS